MSFGARPVRPAPVVQQIREPRSFPRKDLLAWRKHSRLRLAPRQRTRDEIERLITSPGPPPATDPMRVRPEHRRAAALRVRCRAGGGGGSKQHHLNHTVQNHSRGCESQKLVDSRHDEGYERHRTHGERLRYQKIARHTPRVIDLLQGDREVACTTRRPPPL